MHQKSSQRRKFRATSVRPSFTSRPGTTETLEPRVLLSSYYVSQSAGSDANPGSLDAPFATIQQAANVARPGDTVLVRAGTYRESVRPTNSGTASARITFKPYNGESVTISGADVVSGWSNYGGSIFKAPQSWDIGESFNQVFVDGRMMIEARWPNTTLDVSRPTSRTADDIAPNFAGVESIATLRDADLSGFPAGTWDGAAIHFAPGERWVWQSGRVTGSSPGVLNFAYEQRTGTNSEKYETPRAGNPYYLSGKFVALDAAGEWYRDPTSGLLYLWTPGGDNPAGHVVEAKRRQHAFDLKGRSYIDIEGFKTFAANIVTDFSSSGVRIDGIHAKYVSHFKLNKTGWDDLGLFDTGIVLRGKDHVIRNSTIEFSAGHGVYVDGERSVVENNVIRDVAYSGANGAGVRTWNTGHHVIRNTIYNTGRNGINFNRTGNARILYNVVHDAMLQTTDGGGIYTFGTDGQGTEVAYNRIYNVTSGGFGAAGVYLDNNSRNYVVHHNLTYNVSKGMKMNFPSNNNQIYNNTLLANETGIQYNRPTGMTGTAFRNNIFNRGLTIASDAAVTNNIHAGTDPRFVNAGAGDYRLAAGSPAIDAGTALPPYTDGFAGSAPDIGAFETGRAAWVAGASDAYRDDGTPPLPVTGLTAAGNPAGVFLDWTDQLEADRLSYDVYAASSSGGPFSKLNAGPVTRSEYLDTTAPAGDQRHYRVVVRDTAGSTSSPATAAATRPVDTALPGMPTGLKAVAPAGTSVELTWAAASGAARYVVERKGPGESNFSPLGSIVFATKFVDAFVTAGRAYAYRVRAENSLGASGYSPSVNVTTPPVPAVPTGTAAKSVSPTRVDVSWAQVGGTLPDGSGPVASQYIVERSKDGTSNWVRVRTFAAPTNFFSDLNLPAGARYWYRVRAVGPGGTSNPGTAVRPGGTTVTPVPPAPTGLSATAAAARRVDLRWADVSGETGYTVERSLSGTTGFASIGTTGAGVATFADTTAAPDTAYYYRVRATNGTGPSGPSNVASARTPAEPVAGAYTSLDINSTPAGRTTVAAEGRDYDVVAGGENVFGTADGFRFLHRQVTGDFDMKVRVESLTAVHPTSKAGLMARASLAANSANVFAHASAAETFRVSRRASAGAPTYITKAGPVTFPNAWVRLKRVGNTFTGYYSTDGTTWTTILSTTQSMPATLYFGPAVSAVSTTRTTAARFRGLAAVTTTPTAPSLRSLDISSTPAGSTTVLAEGRDYNMTAGGSNIFGNADGFRFVHRQVTGDFDARVRLTSLTQVVAATKAGLMARESLSASSRNIFSSAGAADAFRFSYRANTGSYTSLWKHGTVAYPNVWVRLRRAGNVFTAYYSTNGTTWVQTGSVTMALAPTVYLGLAVSAQSTTATTTATFRDLAGV